MNVIATDLANPSLVRDYIHDLRRLLEAAQAAERNAAEELGDCEPETQTATSAVRSAVDRLNAAREWKDAINTQLTAINRLGRY
ncbi:MAG TPA: hypothetical protein VE046_10960 [Steroidobacteraceae bacterium]|nr:hypothetical protein [Steroidobacteraceae bacterium]